MTKFVTKGLEPTIHDTASLQWPEVRTCPVLCSRSQLSSLIQQFMAECPFTVISTLGKVGPEAALVAFAETDDLELIFQTFVDSRKYENLQVNPNVAFVIGWDEDTHITIQYEGKAEELFGDAASSYLEQFRRKPTPCSDEYLFHEKSRLFRVTPRWIGYSDYTRSPPFVDELFFAKAD